MNIADMFIDLHYSRVRFPCPLIDRLVNKRAPRFVDIVRGIDHHEWLSTPWVGGVFFFQQQEYNRTVSSIVLQLLLEGLVHAKR